MSDIVWGNPNWWEIVPVKSEARDYYKAKRVMDVTLAREAYGKYAGGSLDYLSRRGKGKYLGLYTPGVYICPVKPTVGYTPDQVTFLRNSGVYDTFIKACNSKTLTQTEFNKLAAKRTALAKEGIELPTLKLAKTVQNYEIDYKADVEPSLVPVQSEGFLQKYGKFFLVGGVLLAVAGVMVATVTATPK